MLAAFVRRGGILLSQRVVQRHCGRVSRWLPMPAWYLDGNIVPMQPRAVQLVRCGGLFTVPSRPVRLDDGAVDGGVHCSMQRRLLLSCWQHGVCTEPVSRRVHVSDRNSQRHRPPVSCGYLQLEQRRELLELLDRTVRQQCCIVDGGVQWTVCCGFVWLVVGSDDIELQRAV